MTRFRKLIFTGHKLYIHFKHLNTSINENLNEFKANNMVKTFHEILLIIRGFINPRGLKHLKNNNNNKNKVKKQLKKKSFLLHFYV